MMQKFIIYIVLICFIFNVNVALGADNSADNLNSIKEKIKNEYVVKDFGDKESPKKEPLIKANKKLYEFLILPYLIDKLYPGDEIEGDVSPFLAAIYPNTDISKLKYLGDVLKVVVVSKREYKKVVGRLKHLIKAKSYLPKEAPIVAEDGSFAKEEEDLYKETGIGEYKVSYKPYKYLEYDKGELGNAVRRRDKNFIESPDVDALSVALLDFDIKGIIKAIKEMPKFNDGSAEKPFVGDKDIRARILVDTAEVGEKEKINGVIQIILPKGYYINGDYLNIRAIPRFVLNEEVDEKNNIKEYQFFQPLATAIQKDNKVKRILFDEVNIPFSVVRSNLSKSVIIDGNLFFELCSVDGKCEEYMTKHRLKIKKAMKDRDSIYYNHVTQAHTHLPLEKNRFAELLGVYYNSKSKTLDVVIDTKRKFSNVAVMVEDAKNTHFINPKYQIKEDEIVASFEVNEELNDFKLEDVAVSASFNDVYDLRKVVKPKIDEKKEVLVEKHSLFVFLGWGVLANLLFGVFYIFTRMISYICSRDDRWTVFARYMVFSLIGSGICLVLLKEFQRFYVYVSFCVCGMFFMGSVLMELLSYMKFELFRPFRNVLKHGAILGLFTPLIVSSNVFFGIDFWEIILSYKDYGVYCLGAFVLGLNLLIFIVGFVLYKIGIRWSFKLKVFNSLWSFVYLIAGGYFLFYSIGGLGLFITLLGIFCTFRIWYKYPFMIEEGLNGKVLSKKNLIEFKKIELKVFSLIFCIFIVCISLVFANGKAQIINPKKDAIYSVIENKINKDSAVLVAVMNRWTFLSIVNKIVLKQEENKGLTIAYIDASFDNEDARYWLDKYYKNVAPLFVIFSKRHKSGLVLPDNLESIEFRRAIKNF